VRMGGKEAKVVVRRGKMIDEISVSRLRPFFSSLGKIAVVFENLYSLITKNVHS